MAQQGVSIHREYVAIGDCGGAGTGYAVDFYISINNTKRVSFS